MAARSAIGTVLDWLAQGPPGGPQLGPPQTAGKLTLVPILHGGPSLEYVTLADALKEGSIVVTEVDAAGAVPTLEVKNSSRVPVLMVEGEILIGLKQNRSLNTTILVPAQTALKVPVACVEAGRWRPTTPVAGRADYTLSPKVRGANRHSVTLSARAFGLFTADQRAVWDGVLERLGSHRLKSATFAYSDIEKERGREIEDLLNQAQPVPGQAGVLALVAGEPLSLDVFDQAATLARLWQGLVGSYVADALVPEKGDGLTDLEGSAGWLRNLGTGEATCHRAVGMGETVLITGVEHCVSALVVDGVVVHLAACPRDRSRP